MIANAMRVLQRFGDNPLSTCLDNYPVGKALKQLAEMSIRRGKWDEQADIHFAACSEVISPVLGSKVAGFVDTLGCGRLLQWQRQAQQKLAEALSQWSEGRLEEMVKEVMATLTALVLMACQVEFLISALHMREVAPKLRSLEEAADAQVSPAALSKAADATREAVELVV